MSMRTLICVLLTLTVLCSHAMAVTLAWDPNSESDLAGYRVFCRPCGSPYDYTQPAWEGTQTNCAISGLLPGTVYCFVARAFDRAGNESADSNEVTYAPPARRCDLDLDGDCDGIDLADFLRDWGDSEQ